MGSYSNSFLIGVFFFFSKQIRRYLKKKKKQMWDHGVRKTNSIKKKLKTFNQESGPIYHQKKKWFYFVGNVLVEVKRRSFTKLSFSFVSI